MVPSFTDGETEAQRQQEGKKDAQEGSEKQFLNQLLSLLGTQPPDP